MKRYSCSVVCLTMLMLTSTAWSQTSSLGTTGASAISGLSTITATQPASDAGHAIRQELRSMLAQVFADIIQQLFGDLRTSLGLPAAPTGSTTDPLAILESTIEAVVKASVVN